MKKFVLLHYGYETPTPEIMDAWGKWFASIADKTADPGSPFGPAVEITRTGTRALTPDTGAASGYTVINAADMAEAVKIAEGCPIITSLVIYETMSM